MNKEEGAALAAAKRYAEYFLRHPLVVEVHLFGSVSFLGDGNDVDLILVVSDEEIAYEFLRRLRDRFEKIVDRREKGDGPAEAYDELRTYRNRLVIELLGLSEGVASDEFRSEVLWNGVWKKWDELCRQKRWFEAERLEMAHVREADMFIMPRGWQRSAAVKKLLPDWNRSSSPWARFTFYGVLISQSRRYDTSSGTFGPRRKLSGKVEASFQRVLKKERRKRNRQKKSGGSFR